MGNPTNLASKCSRAVCAYLVSQGIDQKQVYPQFTTKDRTFDNGPMVTPFLFPGAPDPKFSGNRRFQIGVSIKGNFAREVNSANPEQPRIDFDAFVGRVFQALMQTDEADGQTLEATRVGINTSAHAMATAGTADEETAKESWRKAANNADMADFTMLQWNDSTYGAGEAKECAWEVVLIFEAAACEDAIA